MKASFMRQLADRLVGGRNVLFYRAVFLFLFLAPIAFLGWFNYAETSAHMAENVLSRKKALAFLAATIIHERLDAVTNFGIFVATRNKMIEELEKGNWPEAIARVEGILPQFPEIDHMVLCDMEGTVKADMPFVDASLLGQSRVDTLWYQQVKKNGRPYVSEVYKKMVEPGVNVVSVSIPVKAKGVLAGGETSFSEQDQKVLAIFQMQFRMDVFSRWLRVVDVGAGDFIYVVDQHGQIVYHPKLDSQRKIIDFSSVPVVRKVLKGQSGAGLNYNPVERQMSVAAYEPVREYGWGVVVTQPAALAFSDMDRPLRPLLMIYGFAFLTALVLALFILYALILQKRAEEEVKNAAAMKSKFTSMVSHELRTPLGPIKEGAAIILDGLVGDINAEQRGLLNIVKNNADRLHRLINDVLDFQKLESGRMPFDLGEHLISDVVREVIGAMSLIAKQKQLELFMVCEQEIPAFIFDRDKIIQVLMNLVSNALKFTDKGHVKISVCKDGNFVHIVVEDTGLGIALEDMPKLFHSFQQIVTLNDRKSGGTGLGLAISKEIIVRHAGKIWAESVFGQGSAFHFLLPIKEKV
jgi:signal transduction histidine kinase